MSGLGPLALVLHQRQVLPPAYLYSLMQWQITVWRFPTVGVQAVMLQALLRVRRALRVQQQPLEPCRLPVWDHSICSQGRQELLAALLSQVVRSSSPSQGCLSPAAQVAAVYLLRLRLVLLAVLSPSRVYYRPKQVVRAALQQPHHRQREATDLTVCSVGCSIPMAVQEVAPAMVLRQLRA